MQGSLVSYALLAALATALVWAAVTDLKRREIDNWLNLAVALGAPVYWLATGMTWVGMAFQIGLAFVTFLFACTLFAIRQMGGGDVKLLTALSLWIVPLSFVPLVMMMAVIGGGASVAMALFNMKRVPGETARDVLSGLIAIGFIWGCAAVAWALMSGTPVISPKTAEAVIRAVPTLWAGLIAAVVIMVIFTLGILHIVKRQRSRLPIPYGVAISAAGLWVLADRMIFAGPIGAQFG